MLTLLLDLAIGVGLNPQQPRGCAPHLRERFLRVWFKEMRYWMELPTEAHEPFTLDNEAGSHLAA